MFFKRIKAEATHSQIRKRRHIFMKKPLFKLAIAAVMIAGIIPMTGLAQGYRHRNSGYNINRRQDYQRDRIRREYRQGDLTRREASRLYNQQRRIERYEYRSRRDGGGLDWRERRNLDRMLDRSRRDIYRQSNDRQDRDRRYRRWYR
jgi:hypothetical protein